MPCYSVSIVTVNPDIRLTSVFVVVSSITNIISFVDVISNSSAFAYILISEEFSIYPAGFKLLNDTVPVE